MPRKATPQPVTWRQLERQIRNAVRASGLRGNVRVIPWTAAEEKAAAARDHAYVYPDRLEFHFSAKTLALPAAHREAIVAHEVGHCLAQHHWGSSTEPEADAAAKQWLGTKICYDAAWPGKGLQVVCSRARAENPESEIRRRLWRASDDDIIVGTASFSPDRACAEAYLDNAPFGGSRLWMTDVVIDESKVLDLREGARKQLRELGVISGSAWKGTTIDQVIPHVYGELQSLGYVWVRHEETFPEGCEDTWTFVGSSDNDPELEEIELEAHQSNPRQARLSRRLTAL